MPKNLNMRAQPKTWRCFHCDEVFTDEASARDHFGHLICSQPACTVTAAQLRELEQELNRYRTEDTELHRQIAHMEAQHSWAIMRSEEAGYARGLRDSRAAVVALSDALRDSVSTFQGQHTFVTEERIEAWKDILQKHGTHP